MLADKDWEPRTGAKPLANVVSDLAAAACAFWLTYEPSSCPSSSCSHPVPFDYPAFRPMSVWWAPLGLQHFLSHLSLAQVAAPKLLCVLQPAVPFVARAARQW